MSRILIVAFALGALLGPRPAAAEAANVRQLAAKARKNKHVRAKPFVAKDAAKAARRKPARQDKPHWGAPDLRKARRR